MSVFYFKTRLNLVEMLGIRVSNVPDLLEQIRLVPGSSIYYHTHRFLQQHNYLCPEPPNDFAFWITNALGLDGLGEQLASVDTIKFIKINDLREAFSAIIEKSLQRKIGLTTICHEGEEFHFLPDLCFCNRPTGRRHCGVHSSAARHQHQLALLSYF
jgi:hypothetical protein